MTHECGRTQDSHPRLELRREVRARARTPMTAGEYEAFRAQARLDRMGQDERDANANCLDGTG